MFAGFSLADPGWHAIRRIPGIDRILSSAGLDPRAPGVPVAVPDAAIEWVRGLLSPNGCLYPPSQRFATDGIAPPIPAGTVLRLTGGAMEGIEGLCEWSDGRRVRLLMTILGRPVAVTADRAAVEMT